MSKKTSLIFFFILSLCVAGFTSNAQDENSQAGSELQMKNVAKPGKNFAKINLTGLLLKNYSLQYERLLSKNISIAFSYRLMPSSTLPFQQSILKVLGDEDPETKKTIEDFRLSNFAITPEIRFYLSRKGYGRGFYIAPFYRFTSFKISEFNVFYTTNSAENSIKLSGKFTGNTGGLLFGVQKLLGKRIVLDTWIFGPHYGSGNGEFKGSSSRLLTLEEQNALRDELNDIEIPLTDKTVNVNANGASVKLDGPWAGLRMGLSLGVKF